MAIDPQFLDCMAQTIEVSVFSGVSNFGDPAYAAPVARTVRIEPIDMVVLSDNGEELKTSKAIYTSTAIGIQDRIWFPGDSSGDATLARLPKRIDELVDENGVLHHYEVLV